MLGGCLESALEARVRDGATSDDRLDADLGEVMVDLARMLFKERLWDVGVTSMRDITQDRIRAFVRRNLGDPTLSVDMIARAMKCSKRYIHKVFNEDQTISEFIWNQRLEQCRAALMQADKRAPTLTQIAFENGFSSSAHFSRAFRARYGLTPRAFRAQADGAGSRLDKMTLHGRESQIG
jgi:AraC-like DNA-binding protein